MYTPALTAFLATISHILAPVNRKANGKQLGSATNLSLNPTIDKLLPYSPLATNQ